MAQPTLPFPVAEAPDAVTEETGRKLFAGEVTFVKGVVAMSGLPPADPIEVCFSGRSNVGKSSLINALTNQHRLARASNTPGRTQEINYFALGAERYLVDLPGYGFAKAPKAVVEKWQALLKAYLGGRPTLRRAFLLIDARHGVKAVDSEIMKRLDTAAVPFQVVLTKADKVKEAERAKVLDQVRGALQKHPAAFPELQVTSSEKGWGIPTLRATIATLTGGFLFATFPGAFYNVLGATIGATAIFLAARTGFGAQLGAKLEGSEGYVKKIKDGIDENQWSMLFLIRLVPAVPFFVANLVPSFLEVPLHRFVISTFLGIIPGALVFTSVGAGLGEVFARGETPNLGIIFEPHILLPLLGLAALAALPVIFKALRGKREG